MRFDNKRAHCVQGVEVEDDALGFPDRRSTSCTDLDGGGECVHCECCCDCMGCLYGPRDGVGLTAEQRAPIADFKPGDAK